MRRANIVPTKRDMPGSQEREELQTRLKELCKYPKDFPSGWWNVESPKEAEVRRKKDLYRHNNLRRWCHATNCDAPTAARYFERATHAIDEMEYLEKKFDDALTELYSLCDCSQDPNSPRPNSRYPRIIRKGPPVSLFKCHNTPLCHESRGFTITKIERIEGSLFELDKELSMIESSFICA